MNQPQRQRFRRSKWILSGCCCAASATAQDLQCLYSANAGATVQIEYKYTTSDGNGTDKGTGFIITSSGYVLTNDHVIRPTDTDVKVLSDKIVVRAGGLQADPVEAKVVARDPSVDLALLRLPPKSSTPRWPAVTISSTTNIAIGEPLIGLGYASGDLAIVPPGIKSANNTIVNGQIKPWWQTTLALNHGNSGGPIFGRLGTVVGLAVVKNEINQLVTYIIPIARAQHLLDMAGVAPAKVGQCANLPQCAHPSHGIERYTIDELKGAWGDWRSGGYNRGAYCGDYLAGLKAAYPASTFTFVRDDEQSERDWVGHVSYRYYCEYRRQEAPIYLTKKTLACVK